MSLYEEILKKSQIQNPESNYGKTPLYIAAGKGHFLLCKTIIESIQDKALEILPAALIKGKNPGYSDVCAALFEAARNGHVEVCKFIIDIFDDKNPKETNGRKETALHVASRNGHLEVCKFIMDKLIDKNPKAEDWSTPLHEAARS